MAFEGNKVLLQRRLREKFAESFAQDYAQFGVQSDESGIKGGIMKLRETEAVARIQALFRKLSPRFDVAGNEQFGDLNAADAAAHIIRIQHRLPKKLLTASRFYRSFNLGRPARLDTYSASAGIAR